MRVITRMWYFAHEGATKCIQIPFSVTAIRCTGAVNMPPKTKYSLRRDGSRISTTIPQKLAFAMGLLDSKGNLVTDCIRFEMGVDDQGPYGIIRSVERS